MINLILIFFPYFLQASEVIATSMVPRGLVVEINGRDFIVKTQAGTKVVIEFRRNGKFIEASGKNLNQGDEIEPGDGLISLSSAAQAISTVSKVHKGYWTLEEDNELGWIYEFEEAIVSAKNGKLIKRMSSPSTLSDPEKLID